MHTALLLVNILLLVLGGYGLLGSLRHRDWARRRAMQGVVLFAPVVSLGLGLAGLRHFVGRPCFLGAPRWDKGLALVLLLGMGLVALGGLALGLFRHALMAGVVRRRGVPAGPELVAGTARLADRLGLPRPRVLVCPYDRPLALTYGLWRPTVLVSSWLLEHLDARELEAVLAHELAHSARRDYLVVWLATVLRDAFVYLPTSWVAYRQMQYDKELACDDLAVGATARPLALASALAKTWQPALVTPCLGVAQSLLGGGEAIEDRITRLLSGHPLGTSTGAPRAATTPARGGTAVVAGFLAFGVTNLVAMSALLGCGPVASLGRLF